VVVWYYADVANTTSASTLDWTYTTSSSASTADWGYATWPTMTIQWVNPAETADQRRVREERVTAERARAVQERAERLVADRRAEQLLVRHLTPEQRRTLRRNRWFVIEGQSGRRYQIGTAQHAGNIRLLGDDGEPVEQLCCHPRTGEVPLYDSILTQKLMLEGDEETFRRIANITPLPVGRVA
jgi:hypothetical protein